MIRHLLLAITYIRVHCTCISAQYFLNRTSVLIVHVSVSGPCNDIICFRMARFLLSQCYVSNAYSDFMRIMDT